MLKPSESQPFQTFADSYSGFLPPGARYQGTGYWDLPGTGRPRSNGPPTLRTADPSRPRGSDDGTNEGRSYRLGATAQRLFNHRQNPLTIEHFTPEQESWIRYEMQKLVTPNCSAAYEVSRNSLRSPRTIIETRGVVIRHARALEFRSATDLGLDPRTYRDAQKKAYQGQGMSGFGTDGRVHIFLNNKAFLGPSLANGYDSLSEVLNHEFIHEGLMSWPDPTPIIGSRRHDLAGFPGYRRIMQACR